MEKRWRRTEEDARGVLEQTVERVQVRMWWLDVHHELCVLEVLLRVDRRRRLERFPDLEVGLAVEILGLYIADPVRVRG